YIGDQPETLSQRCAGGATAVSTSAGSISAFVEPIRWTFSIFVEPGTPGGDPATITTRSSISASSALTSSWSICSVILSVESIKGTSFGVTPHDKHSTLLVVNEC